MKPGVVAAVDVARRMGIESSTPLLLQETNNTVVWLRPHPVIAKVGTHSDSSGVLGHEHRVASALAEVGAPAVAPVGGTGVERHESTGFTVTLWHRLERAARAAPDADVAVSLGQLHRSLETVKLDLPPLGDELRKARAALSSDVAMTALPAGERAFLREAFDDLVKSLEEREFPDHMLHGEPHEGNRVETTEGIRWIDFEGACRGPLEWDLVFLPDQSLSVFEGLDGDLLELLRTLDAARRATWAWVQARFPEMRRFGEEQLRLVRARWPGGGL